jgi:hypothetical protein
LNRRRAPVRRAWIGRTLARLALAGVAALLTWKLVAEFIEPHFLLWLRPASPALEASTVGGTTVRLYSDTRPYIGKIAALQKGLIWLHDGRQIVKEGYGFGCPIIEVGGQAYLARHARTETILLQEGTRLVKHFALDTVDTPIQLLRRKYRPAPSLGIVTFQYDIHPDGTIDVQVDFSGLKVPWDRAYLMNEQGANHFLNYSDSNGSELEAADIGIWQRVEESASRACFDSPSLDLRFCVEPEERPILYFGRERYWQYNWRGVYYLSWSGIDIELEGPRESYRYRIVLEAR